METQQIETVYTCDKCGKTFDDRIYYYNHTRLHFHLERKTYTCEQCGRSFGSLGFLKRHRFAHMEPEECGVCGRKVVNLHRHMKLHTARLHQCEQCGKAYILPSCLKAHMRSHTGERPFPCKKCGKRFMRSTHLIKHMKTHSGREPTRKSRGDDSKDQDVPFEEEKFQPVADNHTDKRTSDGLATQAGNMTTHQNCVTTHQADMSTHQRAWNTPADSEGTLPDDDTVTRPWLLLPRCDKCNKTYGTTFDLRVHMRVYHPEEKIKVKCDECHKVFSSKRSLAIHSETHVGQQSNNECHICGKHFRRLSEHMMTMHSRTRPHECQVCGKGFISQNKIRRHMKCHAGDQGKKSSVPLKCNFCGKYFRQLSDHIKTVHSWTKSHQCQVCGKGFTSQNQINRHMKSHAGEEALRPTEKSASSTKEKRSIWKGRHKKRQESLSEKVAVQQDVRSERQIFQSPSAISKIPQTVVDNHTDTHTPDISTHLSPTPSGTKTQSDNISTHLSPSDIETQSDNISTHLSPSDIKTQQGNVTTHLSPAIIIQQGNNISISTHFSPAIKTQQGNISTNLSPSTKTQSGKISTHLSSSGIKTQQANNISTHLSPGIKTQSGNNISTHLSSSAIKTQQGNMTIHFSPSGVTTDQGNGPIQTGSFYIGRRPVGHRHSEAQQQQESGKCKVCGKHFYHLANHMMTMHSRTRPHECQVCGKGFILHNRLQRHMKCHVDEEADHSMKKSVSLKKKKTTQEGRQQDKSSDQPVFKMDGNTDLEEEFNGMVYNYNTADSDGDTHPSDVNTHPADVNTHSSDVNTHPADVNTQPSDVNTQPSDVNTQPSNVNTLPSNVNTQPSDVNTHPSERLIHVCASDKASLAEDNKTQSAATTTDPRHKVTPPGFVNTCQDVLMTHTVEKESLRDDQRTRHSGSRTTYADTTLFSVGGTEHTNDTSAHMKTHSGDVTTHATNARDELSHFTSGASVKLAVGAGPQPSQEKEVVQCDECGKTFANRWKLLYHQKTSHREKPFECGACGRKFLLIQKLVEHVTMHTGEKPFLCETCGMRFAREPALQSHVLTHANQKPFQCKECGKRFLRKNNLRKHMKTHSKDKTVLDRRDDSRMFALEGR